MFRLRDVNSLAPARVLGTFWEASSLTFSAETLPMTPAGRPPSSTSVLPDSSQECAQTSTFPTGKLWGNVTPYSRLLPGIWMLTNVQTRDPHISRVRPTPHRQTEPTWLTQQYVEDCDLPPGSALQPTESGGPGKQPVCIFPGPPLGPDR